MVAKKEDLQDWIKDGIRQLGGRATVDQVAKYIWDHHERDLKSAGKLLYTWQYDMRWAANILRRKGILKAAEVSPRGIWELLK